MSRRKVRAIFDDGTSFVLPSHYLLAEDGTVGEAVECFQKNHAPLLWKTPHVELVGILSGKDLRLPYDEAIPSLTLTSFKLNEVMEPDDFLVFCSAPEEEVESDTTDVKQEDTTDVKQEDTTDVKQEGLEHDEEGGESEEQETAEGSPTEKSSKSTKSAIRRNIKAASEARRLADFLLPPVAELQRTRKKRDFFAPGVEQPRKKQARLCRTTNATLSRRERTPSCSKKSIGSRHVSTTSSNPNLKNQAKYEVGTRHFYLWKDGVEYPVTVQQPSPNKRLKPNERLVTVDGYGRTQHKVLTTHLLPVTPEREARFQKSKQVTADSIQQKKEQQRIKEERRVKRKQAQKEQAKKEAKAIQKERERELYGKRTSWKGPFPYCSEPGTLFLQETRRVYFTEDNERPLDIAKKFGVPADKIVYDNGRKYPSLRESSPLKPLTCIVLPLDFFT